MCVGNDHWLRAEKRFGTSHYLSPVGSGWRIFGESHGFQGKWRGGGGERVSRRQYSRRREGTIDYLLMKGNHT